MEIQRCTDKSAWDDFILDNDGHPLQLWGWGQVKAAHGWQAERFFVYEGDVLVVAVQVLVRPLPFPFRSLAYVPRGPVGNEAYFQQALDEIALIVKRDHKSVALSVEINSRETILNGAWQKSPNKILSRETILLDLRRSESDLLADMSKKTRQYIRKSAADGVTIRQIKSQEELDACLQIYADTAKRAGFNLHDKQYYRDVYRLMGDHSPVFVALVDNSPVAFLWLAVSASTAYELYGGMNEVGQKIRANYALKWQVIRKAKEWGLDEYDFGGLVAGGVSNFKQGWASQPTEFAGTFDRPLSPLYGLWTSVVPSAKAFMQKLRKK